MEEKGVYMIETSSGEQHTRTVQLLAQAATAVRKSWHSRVNAGYYHQFATTQPLYGTTSRRLVALAGLKPGMRVVDLACGTGVTTAAILERLGESVEVIAVDQSEAQLEVARQLISATTVHFIRGRAEEIDKLVREPVDCVLCNSALWQMKIDKTLRALQTILPAAGRFVFNMGSWLFPSLEQKLLEPEFLAHAVETGSQQGMALSDLMRQIARSDYGYAPPVQPQPNGQAYEARFMASLGEAGFELVRTEGYAVKRTPAAIYEWYKVPVFRSTVLPGMDVEASARVLDRAYALWQPPQACFYSCSINFVARRRRQ